MRKDLQKNCAFPTKPRLIFRFFAMQLALAGLTGKE
jgi:hypothetical protein